MNDLRITNFSREDAADFKRLNLAWIAHYFTVEPHDLEQLEDPHGHIIAPGGHILLAKIEDTTVGTVALVPAGDGNFELAKMAVDDAWQGRQIGKRLGEAAIEQARAAGAREIWLESNRRLAPALNLYTRLGFVEVPMAETPYARADIKMVLTL